MHLLDNINCKESMIKHLYYTHYHLVCLLQTLSCNAACYTITVFTFSASLSLALLIFQFVFLYSHNSLSSINPKNGIVAVKPFILSCSKDITRSLSSSLSLAFYNLHLVLLHSHRLHTLFLSTGLGRV